MAPPAYQKIRDLAKGGMGQVELVVRRQGSFARAYARKRLLAHFAADDEVRGMFLEEARVAGLIRHANTVPVLDVGEDDVGPYLVMDFIAGIHVGQLVRGMLKKGAQVPIPIALEIVRQAAEGLHAVHTVSGSGGEPLGLVHRDVTPANIMVGFDGCVRVTDFGVARALDRVSRTRPGVLKGKAGYMSPEQLRFEPLDARSDLFSLGVVLYELLAGRRLYGGGMEKAAPRILREPPPDVGDLRPTVPPEVVDLVYRLLAKTPEARPPTAREVARTLDSIARELEPMALGELLDEHFAEERARTSAMIDEALAAGPSSEPISTSDVLELTPATLAPSTVRGRSRRLWGLAAAVVLAGSGAGVYAALLAPEEASPVGTPLAPAPVADPPEQPPEEPAVAAPEPEVEPPEVEMTEPVEVPEEPAPRTRRARRMRATPMERATTTEAPTETTTEPSMATSPQRGRMRAVWVDY